eukprot:gnl/Chilomastix_caulleri/4039.p1 GENE.gnl/Chilomastix_caulleri/4039~~gnl/Chilomastix_caulleri/4039.p1  ORF type:complete len:59 (-),score=1.72 gnl/Chilomastix_caulleri/4039:27-203(-)
MNPTLSIEAVSGVHGDAASGSATVHVTVSASFPIVTVAPTTRCVIVAENGESITAESH